MSGEKFAKDFTSPQALKKYLQDHPDADRSQHRVVKPTKGPKKVQPPPVPGQKGKPAPGAAPKKAPPPIPPQAKKPGKQPPQIPPQAKKAPPAKGEHAPEHGHGGEHGHEPTVKEELHTLGQHAKAFVKSAPKAFQQFVSDPKVRKQALASAKDHLLKSPKAIGNRLLNTAREEVHEFKTAGAGLAKVIKGGKMSKHEKHAVKTVAKHLAIGATAAALTASGPVMAVGVFAKNFAKGIAYKAVRKSLSKLHTLEEYSHIGHGLQHFFEHFASEEDGGKGSPEQALANLVMATVAQEISKATDADVNAALNKSAGKEKPAPEGNTKVASANVMARFLATK